MYHPKTQQNDDDVQQYLNSFSEDKRYSDIIQIVDLMQEVSGCQPQMWGTQIIGFDSYDYQGKSSAGKWFCLGFAPRKQNLSLHIISGFEQEPTLMSQLGKYTTGRSCLYIKRLSDIDIAILKELLEKSMAVMKQW